MNLRIKESLEVLYNPETESCIFFSPANRTYREFKVDGLIKRMIDLLASGEKETEEIFARFGEDYPAIKIDSAITALEKQGILIGSDHKRVIEEYDRQISFISEFTSDYGEAVRIMDFIGQKRVAVFGVGGIGSWMINGLAKIGVKHLNICDPDVVSITNLNRQLFFNRGDVGKQKVQVISERLKDLEISSFELRVSRGISLDSIVYGTDLIINCADEPSVEETSQILNSYSKSRRIPLCISGGYNLHQGFVGPILIPGKTATLEDYISYNQRGGFFEGLKLIRPQTQTGSLGVVAGVVSNIQCAEIFKYFTGIGKMKYNHYGEFDFLDSSLKWTDFSKGNKK
jgi:molybdopterin-synthase adenylyltransferase